MPGYSHFDNTTVCGGEGLAVGANGSEVPVADSDGNLSQAGTQITASAAEINKKLDLSANTMEVTTTSAATVTSAISNLEINISSGAGAITIPDLADHQGEFFIKQTGASTSGAAVTATSGTWDGSNNVATTNAANDALLVRIDSNGNGTIIENVGSVALS